MTSAVYSVSQLKDALQALVSGNSNVQVDATQQQGIIQWLAAQLSGTGLKVTANATVDLSLAPAEVLAFMLLHRAGKKGYGYKKHKTHKKSHHSKKHKKHHKKCDKCHKKSCECSSSSSSSCSSSSSSSCSSSSSIDDCGCDSGNNYPLVWRQRAKQHECKHCLKDAPCQSCRH